jgi:hypothetical protein
MWLRTNKFTDFNSAYFASLGRALALATNFEQNVKFVFGTIDLNAAFERDELEAGGKWKDYGKKLMKRQLGKVLLAPRDEQPIPDDEFKALDDAREERNYLAHEAAAVGMHVALEGGRLCGFTGLKRYMDPARDTAAIAHERDEMLTEHLRDSLPRFSKAVTTVARGDNIVAGYSYMIQETEDYLPAISDEYVAAAVAWVLEPLHDAGIANGLG